MSGWIKLDKDRRDDPRVIRMARSLRDALASHERFTSSIYVTLVLGCLDQLWCYADTHIREDDTLDLGSDEIDELVGLKGFCNIMPPDWLECLDSNRVKLPDFHAHNGTDSKRRALTQKRMERHRNAAASQSEATVKRTSVTDASPDQTRPRPDQDQKEETSSRRNGARVPSRHIELVFAHWQKVHEHPTAKLDEKRRRIIAARLKDFTLEQLRECIDGYALSPFHNGQNENGATYDSIELILRDTKHVEQGMKFHANPPKRGQGVAFQPSRPAAELIAEAAARGEDIWAEQA